MSKRNYGKPINFGMCVFDSSIKELFADLQYDIGRKLERTEMVGELLRLGSMEILAVVTNKCDICKSILNIDPAETYGLPSKDSMGWYHKSSIDYYTECYAGDILDKYYEVQEALNT